MSYRDCKLYVGNLSSSSTRSDLEKEFGYFGHLVNVWVARNPPGFAYVEFEDARDASDAVRGLDGRTVLGRKIRVEVAHGTQRSRAGSGWGGQGGGSRRSFDPNDRCYNCGECGHYAYDCSLYNRRRSSKRSRSRSRSRSRRSRSRSRHHRRRSHSRSRSNSRSKSRSPRRKSYSRSRSRSASRSRSRSRSGSRGRNRKQSREKSKSRSPIKNGRSKSRSRSRSSSHSK